MIFFLGSRAPDFEKKGVLCTSACLFFFSFFAALLDRAEFTCIYINRNWAALKKLLFTIFKEIKMSQIKNLAKTYVQTRSGTPDRSSSSSQQHQSNSQSSGTNLRLDFQQGKQKMSKSSQRALRETELNMTGLSQRTRSNREGRINELAAQHGSNVIDLVTFVRSLIPWTCLCIPGS